MSDAELRAYLELAKQADTIERGTVQGVDCRVRFINRSTSIGPDVAREVLRLRELVHKIDLTLRVPAAEYVPAIGDVFKLIDEIGKAASDGK